MERMPSSKMTLLFLLSAIVYGVSTLPAPDSLCSTHYYCVGCPPVQACPNAPVRLSGTSHVRAPCSGTYCSNTGPITCVQNGVFPDPSDCRLYYICHNGISHSYTCSTGERFNGTVCEKHWSCQTFNCKTTQTGYKAPHPVDPTVFAYCLNGEVQFIDRCPPYTKIYPSIDQCLPLCDYDGRNIPDPVDSRTYYRCSRTNAYLPFDVEYRQCSTSYRFSNSSKTCVYSGY